MDEKTAYEWAWRVCGPLLGEIEQHRIEQVLDLATSAILAAYAAGVTPVVVPVEDEPWDRSISDVARGDAAWIDAYTEAVPNDIFQATCTWAHEPSEKGTWETTCGHLYTIRRGTPKINAMRFCPFCGKPLEEAEDA